LTTHADGTPGTYLGGYAPVSPQAAPSLPPEPPTSAAPARSAAVASRTTRRALIISVLVVLVGGVLAFGAAQVLTRHTQVLAVSQDVTVGAMITDADLSVASVTKDPNISSIPASERSQIVGMIARVGLVKGELLTRAQVGTSSGFAPGEMLVALALKQGEFPVRGLTAGQTVLIVATPGANGSTSGAGSGAGSGSSSNGAGTGSFSPGIDGTVAEVGTMNPATQVTVIDVRVSQSDGVSVARLASTGNLAVILLPAGR
jgi:hypothetical protein